MCVHVYIYCCSFFLCSVSSNIAQAFLVPVLEAFFHGEVQVRLGAVQAMVLILRQGLVHPAQVCVHATSTVLLYNSS